ncbi:hypothetical protein RvY_03119 [Ramazzottius varieornatus]|uniref:Uncharacterized protein n=1 Tax=Ramazzottius varieornatus TaxID=947166 RepID=A0A1D1UM09_RAMVA|nr:hypothetical protein RvY_03119 [Ramazzottius varieornatus]
MSDVMKGSDHRIRDSSVLYPCTMPPIKFTGEVVKKLTLLYGNVNDIRSKSEETKRWMEERNAGIVALVETWADESTADCLIADLDQYNLFRKD